MAKETKKTREELIAEANKPKDAEKAMEPISDELLSQGLSEPEDPPLDGDAAKKAKEIMASDEGSNAETIGDPEDFANSERGKNAKSAHDKLMKIYAAYSPTATNEHIIFGNGGGKFTLGDLRALLNIPGY